MAVQFPEPVIPHEGYVLVGYFWWRTKQTNYSGRRHAKSVTMITTWQECIDSVTETEASHFYMLPIDSTPADSFNAIGQGSLIHDTDPRIVAGVDVARSMHTIVAVFRLLTPTEILLGRAL